MASSVCLLHFVTMTILICVVPKSNTTIVSSKVTFMKEKMRVSLKTAQKSRTTQLVMSWPGDFT